MQTFLTLRHPSTNTIIAAIIMLASALPSKADDIAQVKQAREVHTVALLVFNGMDIQDFAGPADVFFYAGQSGQNTAFKQFAVSKTLEPITSQGFVKIQPNYTFEDCPKPDILVVPGGNVSGLIRDEATMKWISETARDSQLVLSVCTGALVLQRAGLLEGISATTHWGSITRLREQSANTNVLEDVRYVDSGKIVTSAGVSAGIDMSLHVVARLIGLEAAQTTARRMEYEWKPREDYPTE